MLVTKRLVSLARIALLCCLTFVVLALALTLVARNGDRETASVDRPALPVDSTAAATMLGSGDPESRASATAWIGRLGRPELTPLIVPRMSDADWRVRAAAFDAARRLLPGTGGVPPESSTPLRDTPVAEREDVVFQWINAWRGAAGPQSAGMTICDVYAPANHWLTGIALAESCMKCHVPPDQFTAADSDACATCHERAHDSWLRSAHAQTTTHMRLARIDDRTKEIVAFDYGERSGLLCTSCHVPSSADDGGRSPTLTAAATLPGTENLRVPHRFEAIGSESCAGCHQQTQREWEGWRQSASRPLKSPWLPGEVTWDDQPDARTCVTCHMTPAPGETRDAASTRDHGFAARRDPRFMRDGLAARIEPPTAGRNAQLVLTNLAGHAYPSGGVRRALRVQAVYDGDESTRRVLTRLTRSVVPSTQPVDPPLAPAEQRHIDLPRAGGATRITCEIVYERNQYEPGSYEFRLYRLSESLVASPAAAP